MTPSLRLLQALVPYEQAEKISISSLDVNQKGRSKKLEPFKFNREEEVLKRQYSQCTYEERVMMELKSLDLIVS